MKDNRRRRIFPLVALGAAASVFLAGCSSSSSGQSSGSKPAQGSQAGAGSSAALSGAASGSLFKLLPAKIQQAGKIVIGSAINYPPFENYAPDGKTLVGFEVELASALEKVLGVKFQWDNGSFDTLFASLKAGRYDVMYGATNDTPEREQAFDFVDYVLASQGFDVARGNPDHIAAVDDLCGKSVAAVTGGVQVQFLETQSGICTKSGKGKITVLSFADAAGEQLAVREGKAVALLENYPTAVTFAQQSKGVLQLVSGLQVLKTYFGMVLPKSSSQLRDALQKGWAAIIANGAYGKVLAKWNLSGIALETPYINGATSHPAAS